VNKSIEFKGLKAQFIWYLGAVVIVLLILFAIMYIAGVNSFICIGLVLIAGTLLVNWIYLLSNKYGEYGLMKIVAKRSIPKVVKTRTRILFKIQNTDKSK
jgi:cell division protein FtsW (lipid II flippase)